MEFSGNQNEISNNINENNKTTLSVVKDEESLENWLPLTSSRKAKWWYSAIHNVTGMVGAGILGLPFAMGPGVTLLVLSWAITLYTLWQMVEMHEAVPGKRFDRYHELGQHAFGDKLGLWLIVPQQVMVQAGCDIVYMVTGGSSLMKFYSIVCPDCKPIKLSYFIMMFASIQFILSILPNLTSITGVSFAAAVMSLSYSAIAWIASAIKGVQQDISYGSRYTTTPGHIFGFLSGLGTVAFAFSGHNIVLEIQASIPSTPDRPSKIPMWKGSLLAYIIIGLCYFPPIWLIAAANIFVVIHVIGSYQVYAMPIFDMLESFLVLRMKCRPTRMLRIVTRYFYVAITMFIGIAFPFFGSLLSVLGGIAFAPTSFYLPCIIWLIISKPKKYSISWFCNWLFIIFGMSLTILAPIGAVREIVVQANTFKFFS
ncbi:Lysine histidine transporter 1 [Bienertia sinuspersici]